MRVAAGISLALAVTSLAEAASLFKPLSEAETTLVRSTLAAMKKDPRGPYLRIRWYCKDGTVLPPTGTPCRERGGGVQHAELSAAALRLAELHFDVGVILQALSYEQFVDADRDFDLPRQLVLQNYLTEVDEGWIYRRARFYRGARQIEDEEAQGQVFLQKLFGDGHWVDRHFLLARALAGVVPHLAMSSQANAKIRNLASEIADLEPSFQDLRVKIHSFPSASDLEAVERFLQRKGLSEEVKEKLESLRDQIGQFYDPRQLRVALQEYRKRLSGLAPDIDAVQTSIERDNAGNSLAAVARLAVRLRRDIASNLGDSSQNLRRLDLIILLQDRAFALAQGQDEPSGDLSRGARVAGLSVYFDLAYAFGFLSAREVDALRDEMSAFEGTDQMSVDQYQSHVAYLTRSLDWGRSAVQGVFGPLVERYEVVEPKAAGFSDALIRSSILLPLSRHLGILNADADASLGQSHDLMGRAVSQGVRGLNPGVAKGILEILDKNEPSWLPDPKKIYVIPDTVADLKPMAGILTLDAGNLLSHAQLLARNLGIPNAAISPSLLPTLEQSRGALVYFAVAPSGRVILKQASQMTPSETDLVADKKEPDNEKVRLDTARLRLDKVEPIPLEELRLSDSGVVVGPKAANLGQLHHYFPGRVSAGVALPFGMYRRHIARPYQGSGQTLEAEIREAYRSAQRMTDEGASETAIDQFMFPRLARFRRAIEEMEWDPDSRRMVVEAIRRTFANGVAEGVFVRSDTNAEDLPQFSGAGLNLTIPNQRTTDDVLVAIKKVWASPFSERAYLWRRQLLVNQEDVYTSVLLLQSVPSEVSGVLITSGLDLGDSRDLTVVVAEGVGGVVEGDSAESLLVHPDGRTKLLSQAKAPYRRQLGAAGGVTVTPTSKRDTLLERDQIAQLQSTVTEWRRQVPSETATIWDMEFGFVGKRLWLFQIRPFVGHRNQQILRRLAELYGEPGRLSNQTISLRKPI